MSYDEYECNSTQTQKFPQQWRAYWRLGPQRLQQKIRLNHLMCKWVVAMVIAIVLLFSFHVICKISVFIVVKRKQMDHKRWPTFTNEELEMLTVGVEKKAKLLFGSLSGATTTTDIVTFMRRRQRWTLIHINFNCYWMTICCITLYDLQPSFTCIKYWHGSLVFDLSHNCFFWRFNRSADFQSSLYAMKQWSGWVMPLSQSKLMHPQCLHHKLFSTVWFANRACIASTCMYWRNCSAAVHKQQLNYLWVTRVWPMRSLLRITASRRERCMTLQ